MLQLMVDAKNASLSQLLPYDISTKKNKDLKTGLLEMKMLLEALKISISAFKNSEFEKFDALVGENACQIRAIWLALMAENLALDYERIEKHCFVAQQVIETVLASEIDKLMLSGTTLDRVIEDKDLDILLTREEMLLLQAYLLTVTRGGREGELCVRRSAEPRSLKQFGDVSSTFARNLLHVLRKNISKLSVEFIREHASIQNDEVSMKMCSEEFTIRHNSTFSIPMFWTYKVVLNAAKQAQIPILLHVKFIEDAEQSAHETVDEECVLFTHEVEGDRYIPHPTPSAELDRPAFIVQGVCVKNGDLFSKEQWRSRLDDHTIESIILAGAADHRQYPEVSHDHMVEKMNDEHYNSFKEMALKDGFALKNPTKFFIQHVYAAQVSTLSHVMKDALLEMAIEF